MWCGKTILTLKKKQSTYLQYLIIFDYNKYQIYLLRNKYNYDF